MIKKILCRIEQTTDDLTDFENRLDNLMKDGWKIKGGISVCQLQSGDIMKTVIMTKTWIKNED